MLLIQQVNYRRDFDPRWAKNVRAIALVKCPGCGIESTLSANTHTVATDGTVTPSYVCPHTPCTFHEWVKLDGWRP
jgi:hypothetical protein